MTCTKCNGTGRNLGALWGQSAEIICDRCAGDGESHPTNVHACEHGVIVFGVPESDDEAKP